MKLSNFPPSSGIALQPNVRCLVGLYGSLKDSSSEDFNQLLEEDQDEQEILRYAINHDETDEVRFLVGSQSLKSQDTLNSSSLSRISKPLIKSQITLVTLVESIDIDLKKQTFAHPHGEVTSLVLLPSKPDCFISLFTSYSNEQPELRTGARLWRISNLNENLLDDEINESVLSKSPLDHNNSSTMNNSLDYVTTLPLDKYYGIKRITSHPSTTSSDLACIVGPPVEMSGPCFWMENANWPCVRDIDYNPHRPNLLISGGDDGILRLWDLRYLRTRYRCLSTNTTAAATNTHIPNASERIMQYGTEPTVQPLFAIASHSHWIWSVRYHPTRDQLVLSSGSDGRVCLYNLPSYSSDALLNNDIKGQPANNHSQMELPDEHDDHSSCCSHEDEIDKNEDGLIARLEQHEESVYAVEWSPVDAWYFASISYDGNFLINRVPDQIKLNILLQSNDY
ncbi:EARP-interacting protein like [Schistosoma japonicum]|nr:EARP-interacting protein like [Schistosoma japonicum]